MNQKKYFYLTGTRVSGFPGYPLASFSRPPHPLWRSESQSPQVSIFRDSYLFLPIWLWNGTNGTGVQFRNPIRRVFRDTAVSSSKAPIGTVSRYPPCVPPQGPFEQSEQCRSKPWKRLNDAAGIRQQGCDVRTHDAESVTSVCSEHHCRMACSGAYRIFLAEEDWCCLQDSQVSPLRSHFSWKIPSWNCSAPQLFPRFGWT